MTLKIEPFNRLYFYHFNCSPNIEQYEKIVTWERNEKIMVTDGEGIETDYHFACRSSCDVPHLIQQRHYLWNDYIDICCGDKMQEMLKETNFQNLNLQTIWTQITSGKTWHGPHDHGAGNDGTNWSFVYFVDVDKESGHEGTMFSNPADSGDCFQAEPKAGNMYLWPSNILHYQPPSFCEKPRKIISGNITLS